MGYNTYFSGELTVTPPLNEAEASFLDDFTKNCHTPAGRDPLDVAKGEFSFGRPIEDGKPDSWCGWTSVDGNLAWDEGEKTYLHDDWLVWLIEHLFGPQARQYIDAHLAADPRLAEFTCDHVVSGEMDAQGEDFEDMWQIKVENNQVRRRKAVVTYVDDVA